ncbi:derlin-1-like [Malania oleifera]|uniref:derlin-1-like n=1 Tax=Malania oleifera TaxID=397392 RepID=UPI0025AE2859|nr:derlin-1-like [Malania oleifera]
MANCHWLALTPKVFPSELNFQNAIMNYHYIYKCPFHFPPPHQSPPPSSAMSTPLEYYKSLPPVSKVYGVACLMTTAAYHLELYNYNNIALHYGLVLKRFQVWRLITNFLFLGIFSFRFAFRLFIIAKYGVLLERGPFDKRTADFLWMLIFGALSLLALAAVPALWSPFMGASLVFMIVYVWGREFPNALINIYGLVSLKGFYLPWAMLALDLLFGNPLKPDILGIVVGHLYYFLTVLHPLAGGKYIFKTPLWVHKLAAYWGEGVQVNSPVQRDPAAGVAFRGRSFRLDGRHTRPQATQSSGGPPEQPDAPAGGAFRGSSHRLGDN